MHHKGFVKRLFVILAFNVISDAWDNAASILWVDCVSKTLFPQHAHRSYHFYPGRSDEMGVRHPGRIEVNRRDIQRLLIQSVL